MADTGQRTMLAVVLDAPGPVSALHVRRIPLPTPHVGQVRIKVMAAGVNRSELHTRLGLAEGVTFPRVLGIEAVGVVDECPGGEFEPGQQVATMMGGMGRTFDGGYAQYTCVPVVQVIPFQSHLDWATLGAVPEILQTAYGSLTVGMAAKPGDTILIRGGTSAVGMAAAVLAKSSGVTVLSTTRNETKADALRALGVDHVVLDQGAVADRVRDIVSAGVDAALELVGAPTLRDTLRATRPGGVVCFTGMLSNEWVIKDFYPVEFIPNGVRLTAYSGEASDLPAQVLQSFLDDVAKGVARVPLFASFTLDDVAQAHEIMEADTATGKMVLLPSGASGAWDARIPNLA